MSTLTVKLRRDLRRRPAQLVSAAVLVMLGVALFGASYDAYRNLDTGYQALFDKYRFADLTVTGGDTAAIAAQARARPGVQAVTARTVADVPLRMPDGSTLVGRVVGLPRRRAARRQPGEGPRRPLPRPRRPRGRPRREAPRRRRPHRARLRGGRVGRARLAEPRRARHRVLTRVPVARRRPPERAARARIVRRPVRARAAGPPDRRHRGPQPGRGVLHRRRAPRRRPARRRPVRRRPRPRRGGGPHPCRAAQQRHPHRGHRGVLRTGRHVPDAVPRRRRASPSTSC
ncbi:hypothetical protein LUX57_04915 [Actinomadura madurae]|uniref:hypothetical protein n=1 Tax=Actinomadura madurae TaxID=1993 RepID=UPI0020D24167|nr:hypothetical protein [Actinomadura madurae]MCP9964578.1 hypothetical protein [Actinomadura madurae]